MDDLTHQALGEIRIDVVNDMLEVQYSEPDQGGEVLLRFQIPRESVRVPVLLSGYGRYRELHSRQEIAWGDLPSRIGRDLLPWLSEQRRAAHAGGKLALDSLLGGFERIIATPPSKLPLRRP